MAKIIVVESCGPYPDGCPCLSIYRECSKLKNKYIPKKYDNGIYPGCKLDDAPDGWEEISPERLNEIKRLEVMP